MSLTRNRIQEMNLSSLELFDFIELCEFTLAAIDALKQYQTMHVYPKGNKGPATYPAHEVLMMLDEE